MPGFSDFDKAVQGDRNNEHFLAMNCSNYTNFSGSEAGILHGNGNVTPTWTDSNTVADIHSHPEGSIGPPSASDVWGAMFSASHSSSYQGRYIMAPDGSFYCVAITNRTAALNFMRNNTKDDVISSSGNTKNGFNQKSEFADDFRDALDQFSGLDPDDAWCHALSAVAEMHGMGITIMKAESKTQPFKSKHVIKMSNSKYIAAECE